MKALLEPVAMLMPLLPASLVVMRSVPLELAAATSPTKLLTVWLAVPARVRVVSWARAAALVVIVSPVPLAVIVVALLPLAMLMPLSVASPVVTLSVPLRLVALMSPTRFVMA